jgi:uncharacterized membrane protein YgdD (TMEM256/DUF423 family)
VSAERRIAAVLGALAVAAGAFGAHGLAGHVPPERLDTWKTAAAYQLAHSIVLLVLAERRHRLPFVLFTVGIVLFSGSLYALVLLDQPLLGAITPLGGVAFIIGWLTTMRGADPASGTKPRANGHDGA